MLLDFIRILHSVINRRCEVTAKRIIMRVLRKAGITVGGNAPWDIAVHDSRFYARVLAEGSLGLGESYMEGWWDCQNLDQFFERVLTSQSSWITALNPVTIGLMIQSRLTDLAPKSKAFVVGEEHYDLGNSLFGAMLDPTMAYSCGYWEGLPNDADMLENAQVAKFDLPCRKLGLRGGESILEIGCGWGGFAYHAAKHYGAKVVGLTVSKEQAALARARCHDLPVEIRLEDYRDTNGRFDRIVSIGMFEHVGPKNYRTYMQVAKRCLRLEGLFLLHTIGSPKTLLHGVDPWLRKYIFPVAELPTRWQIRRGSKRLFEMKDWHEFGRFYDPTLMAWHSRFAAAWPKLEAEYGGRVGGQFRRMWEFYLLSCAGAFRARRIELWQIVLSHPDKHRGYQAVR